MLNASVQANDAQGLHDFLLFTVRHVRTLHVTLSALMTDVAAIRQTVLEEPEDKAVYNTNLLSAIEIAKPLLAEAMQSYDEMIQQLLEFEEWKN